MSTLVKPDPALPRSLDCPICPRTEIGSDQKHCPGCGEDLGPLWRLRELALHYYNAGLGSAREGDAERAQVRLHCALELGADEARVRALLGKLCWNRGERAAALSHWRRALEIAPGHRECRRLSRMALRRRTARQLGATLLLAILACVPFADWSGLRSLVPAALLGNAPAVCAIATPPPAP